MELQKGLSSSLGRKYIMSISGAGLVGFIIMHLLGNLTLLDPSGHSFNKYVKGLHDYGWLLVAAEIGLVAIFLLHIYMALRLTANYRAARPEAYAMLKTKGGPSKSSVGSRNMIVTGLLLLAFLIWHIWQFRFGPAESEGYVADINGVESRDLFRLVQETFTNPLYVGIYVVAMLFLALHLRHGFWSMFQSFGALYPRYSKAIYCTALVFAIVWAIGFIILPVAMYIQAGG